MAQQDNDSKLGNASIEGTALPLVKQGIYKLSLNYYETVKLFGGRSPKLALWFTVLDYGEYNGIILPRYYNVIRIKGKPQKYGDFAIGRNSNFLREYVTLFGMPHRIDRIPMTAFKGVILKGKVKPVTRGYNQAKIPKPLQYSVICELTGVKEL